MARCSGTTRSGERCKRDAVGDSDFCTLHGEQTDGGDDAGGGRVGVESHRSAGSDALIVLGAAAVAWAVLRRVLRFL